MFPPISESPPPPIDRDALRAEAVRVQRRRAARAALLALILASSFGTVWVLSSGEIPSRSEWAFSATQVEVLQRRGLDGRGVTICLADTGIDAGHPALRGAPVLAWRDFVDGRVRPYDDDGHGTGMAGLLVGRGPLRGVAPAASLIVAKVLDSRGRGTSASLAAAIGFCVDPNGDGDASDGAAIVSLSLAAAQDLPAGTDAYTLEIAAVGFTGTCYFDAFMSEHKDYFTPYFDGDTEDDESSDADHVADSEGKDGDEEEDE